MNYTEASNAISASNSNNVDILDAFFLPLMISLGYKVGFSTNVADSGMILMNHKEQKITANLNETDRIIFYNSKKPKLSFDEHKIYVHVSENNELIATVPRFRTIVEKYKVKFNSEKEDREQFNDLIDLISLPKSETNFMGSLQLNTDLDNFVHGGEKDLLQTIQHIVNKAVATNDNDFIDFILKKIKENYNSKYNDKNLKAIILEDYKRRSNLKMQYSLVDNNVLNDNSQQNNIEQTEPEDKTTNYLEIFQADNDTDDVDKTEGVEQEDTSQEETDNQLKPIKASEEQLEDKPNTKQADFYNKLI